MVQREEEVNLYLISRKANDDNDILDYGVVAAHTETEAAHFGHRVIPWSKPEEVIVTLIGTALDGTRSGIQVGSFSAQ